MSDETRTGLTGLRELARQIATESIPREWGPGAQRYRRHVLRVLDDAIATTPANSYATAAALRGTAAQADGGEAAAEGRAWPTLADLGRMSPSQVNAFFASIGSDWRVRVDARAAQADTAPEYDPQDNRWDLAAKAQRDGDHAAAPFTERRETPRERAARERQGGGS